MATPTTNTSSPPAPVEYMLVHIIFNHPSRNVANLPPYSTALVPVPNPLRIEKINQYLTAEIKTLFDSNLFDIPSRMIKDKQFENNEFVSATFAIRWKGDRLLPEMEMVGSLDFKRGLEMMRQRGWKDTLVAACAMRRRGSN